MFEMIKAWDCNNCRKWKAHRKKGHISFSIEMGVMKWGMWMFISFVLFQLFTLELDDVYSVVKILLSNFVMWSISGFVYGYLIFYYTDQAYLKNCKSP